MLDWEVGLVDWGVLELNFTLRISWIILWIGCIVGFLGIYLIGVYAHNLSKIHVSWILDIEDIVDFFLHTSKWHHPWILDILDAEDFLTANFPRYNPSGCWRYTSPGCWILRISWISPRWSTICTCEMFTADSLRYTSLHRDDHPKALVLLLERSSLFELLLVTVTQVLSTILLSLNSSEQITFLPWTIYSIS